MGDSPEQAWRMEGLRAPGAHQAEAGYDLLMDLMLINSIISKNHPARNNPQSKEWATIIGSFYDPKKCVKKSRAKIATIFTRDGIKNLGLQIFPENETIASNTCTAIKVPDNIDGSELVRKMRIEHDVVLAGGQASLSGKIFRIGHMGITTEEEIQETLNALAVVLPEIGFKI